MISKNQIKFIQSLHSKKNRDQEQLFIVEGVKLVTEFLVIPHFEIHSVYGTLDFINNKKDIIEKSNVTINQIIAVVKARTPQLNLQLLNSSINLFLDDIRDPGNLGTIVRIADWFGIKQIICSPTSTELYNPKTLQASMGAVLRVNVVYKEFDELKKELKEVPIYGAVLNGQNIYKSDLQHGLIIIGNEANGISENILKQITHPITIPAATNNGSESLNAANACGMICSEFFRQLNFK